MTAPALELLAELHRSGLRLTPDGDHHLRVAPAEKLTPALRQRIVAVKPDLIAALRQQADLERRVRAMAKRWRYTHEELAETLDLAARDPHRWLAACAADENLTQHCQKAGVRWPPCRA